MQLEALQRSMMAAIDGGPDHVPDGVFAGGSPAAMRGFAVHANTISHARLVALEDTFPRTRSLLGEEAFNRLSRAFVETAQSKAVPLASIGRHFPAFLRQQSADELPSALAGFEWAWLASYHAAEARVLHLSDLAGIAEDRLLSMWLARHPAACMIGADAAPALAGAGIDFAGAPMILLTRPEAAVCVTPVTRAMASLFEKLDEPCEVAALITAGEDQESGGQGMLPALVSLIEAGALTRFDKKDA